MYNKVFVEEKVEQEEVIAPGGKKENWEIKK